MLPQYLVCLDHAHIWCIPIWLQVTTTKAQPAQQFLVLHQKQHESHIVWSARQSKIVALSLNLKNKQQWVSNPLNNQPITVLQRSCITLAPTPTCLACASPNALSHIYATSYESQVLNNPRLVIQNLYLQSCHMHSSWWMVCGG